DHRDSGRVHQFGCNIERISNDGDGLNLSRLQLTRYFRRRGARVKDHNFVRSDQFRGRPANLNLLAAVESFLKSKWVILAGFQLPNRTAMGADRGTSCSKGVQVS